MRRLAIIATLVLAGAAVLLDMPDTLSTLLLPELYLAETSAGWRYRAPAPGEYANWQPLDAHPTRGPFATPEEAVTTATQ